MLEVILVSTFLWIGDQIEKTFFQFFLFHDFMNVSKRFISKCIQAIVGGGECKENKKYCKYIGDTFTVLSENRAKNWIKELYK